LRLLAHVFVGILIGLLYFNIGDQGSLVINNAAFIFFSVLFIMFSSLMPTVMTFRPPIGFEEVVRLDFLIYSLSSTEESLDSLNAFGALIFFLPKITFPLIYGIIVYWMTDQPAEFARFMIFLVVCVQTALVGQSLGLVIGAATDLEVAVFLGPATGIPILLFSGFFVTLDAIPKYLQWLSYSSFTRYAFEGAMKVI
uniref:ABC2_membrane domain-containing protein n=1 Tax=Schistocephalus solidus TaxID=70667 RepID=A0A183S993_SCHSO